MYFQSETDVVDLIRSICQQNAGYRAVVLCSRGGSRKVDIGGGSEIHYVRRPDAIRGMRCNLIAVDNTMYSDELMSDIIKPSLMDSNGFSVIFDKD
jgi:hypothetical protein